MRNTKLILMIVTFATLRFSAAYAEKAPLSKKQLEKTATHIIVGKVSAIYSRIEGKGNYEYKHYVAEVKVSKHEKGDAKNQLMYVRYIDISWKGWGRMPPGPSGHWPSPKVGSKYRFYLAQNAYDGFSSSNDGGYNVIYGNGIQPVE